MQDFFSDNTPSVESERILYTPSTFARSSLLHLQEVGSLKAISAHTSSRKDLVSFLCFVVLDGCGELAYEGNTYFLKKGIVYLLIAERHTVTGQECQIQPILKR